MATDVGLRQQMPNNLRSSGLPARSGHRDLGGPINPSTNSQPDRIGGFSPAENRERNVEGNNHFGVGMELRLIVKNQKELRGEVVSFDYGTKFLTIKSPPSNGKQGLQNIAVINVDFVSDIEVLRDAGSRSPPPLPSLNYGKLNNRIAQNVQERERQLSYAGINVSPIAQKLVYAITKTIKEVRWSGEDIVVLDQVVISAPYQTENCRLRENHSSQTHALEHVKKLVSKFHSEYSSSPSSSSVSAK